MNWSFRLAYIRWRWWSNQGMTFLFIFFNRCCCLHTLLFSGPEIVIVPWPCTNSILWAVGLLACLGSDNNLLGVSLRSRYHRHSRMLYLIWTSNMEYRAHAKIKRFQGGAAYRLCITHDHCHSILCAFILIPTRWLREFGIITSISIALEYVLWHHLFPIIFSYLRPREKRCLPPRRTRFRGILEYDQGDAA